MFKYKWIHIFVFWLLSKVLCGFVTECMQKADQSGYVSIAFDALGTGDMKYPETLVARNMYDQVIEYSNSNPNCRVLYVQFVLCPGNKNTLQVSHHNFCVVLWSGIDYFYYLVFKEKCAFLIKFVWCIHIFIVVNVVIRVIVVLVNSLHSLSPLGQFIQT